MKEKTFRVPRRVREQVKYGLQNLESFDDAPAGSLQVASLLASGEPVGPAVPRAIREYFALNIRVSAKSPVAQLFGGGAGREWAGRCLAVLDQPRPLTASAELKDELGREPWDLTDDEVDAILAFARSVSGLDLDQIAAGERAKAEEPVTAPVGEPVSEPESGSAADEAAVFEVNPFEDYFATDFSLADAAAQAIEARRRMEQVRMERARRELSFRMARASVFEAAAPAVDSGAVPGDGGEGGADPKGRAVRITR